jgi:hypothetical protein
MEDKTIVLIHAEMQATTQALKAVTARFEALVADLSTMAEELAVLNRVLSGSTREGTKGLLAEHREMNDAFVFGKTLLKFIPRSMLISAAIWVLSGNDLNVLLDALGGLLR